MLDHVEPRRFLVEPAGENPLHPVLRIEDIDLDEGAGQPLHLPGRGRLAGAKPQDDVPGADRLAGAQLDVARDAVALVEQAEHRHPLRHRRRARRDLRHGLRYVDRLRLQLALFLLGPILLRRALRPAGGKHEGAGQGEAEETAGHDAYSGVHA